MIISIIAAMAENRVIGTNGHLPWHLPSDLAHFRELTMGHPLIMGRKTFESIGKPLPGRITIVMSRQSNYHAADCIVVGSLDAALAAVPDATEIFICGGGKIYRQALPLADRIYLTTLHQTIAGDTTFPDLPADFREVSHSEAGNSPPVTFSCYERIPG